MSTFAVKMIKILPTRPNREASVLEEEQMESPFIQTDLVFAAPRRMHDITWSDHFHWQFLILFFRLEKLF